MTTKSARARRRPELDRELEFALSFSPKMTALGEYYSFRKIFRDLQTHVNVGLKLYKARRTDTDGKFRDLFESFDAIFGPLETHQRKIGERAAE